MQCGFLLVQALQHKFARIFSEVTDETRGEDKGYLRQYRRDPIAQLRLRGEACSRLIIHKTLRNAHGMGLTPLGQYRSQPPQGPDRAITFSTNSLSRGLVT